MNIAGGGSRFSRRGFARPHVMPNYLPVRSRCPLSGHVRTVVALMRIGSDVEITATVEPASDPLLLSMQALLETYSRNRQRLCEGTYSSLRRRLMRPNVLLVAPWTPS
eukprot:4177411-Amphidinium_carterae.1